MKGLFRNSLILMLFLSLVFSIAGVFAAWNYFEGPVSSNGSNLGVSLGIFNYGKAVKFHSFDEEGNDIIYKVVPYMNNESVVQTPEVPEDNANLTFVGWSAIGFHDSRIDSCTLQPEADDTYPNKNYTYGANSTIAISEIVQFADDDGVIDVYDIYEEYKFTMGTAVVDSSSASSYPNASIDGLSLVFKVTVDDLPPEIQDKNVMAEINYGDADTEVFGSPGYISYEFFNRSLYVHPGKNIYLVAPSSTAILDNLEKNYDTQASLTTEDTRYSDKLVDSLSIEPMGKFNYTVNLTIKYTEKEVSNDDDGPCVASGTMITLADGSQIPIEELTMQHKLRVFDHEKGEYTTANILFIEDDGYDYYNVTNCEFSDGKHLRMIGEHALFDLTTNRYEYITEENCAQFIGHEFAVESENGYGRATLTKAYVTNEYTGCYSLPSEYHMNVFIDGMFSMPGGITGLFNFFEFDENLAYDEEKMEQDIALYGLFTYEEFKDYMSEELYNSIFPIKYLKISIGKGLVTMEGIEYIIERYIVRHGLDQIE